ncbi:type IV conjugative transfer system protein TraE [Methylibium petroleiphilum]|uniref:Sex pilus assembly protein n=1 Tax=Methylibium petroleiphilum (strain ATCC BAA-1232 / LMG 22953 / PM1) TaxID=420662 RepID=A2SNK1_METPP|nr:type IV conjugative transfer system protein TraE [Methylibium petroleiphilum]ABM97140.1 sex pilus assembly protein [Methylibium petroleiphilum PM1]
MNLKNMTKTWQAANKVAALMLVSNVALAAALLVSIVAFSGNRERVVLVPPHLEKRVSVGWNTADAEYLKGFGTYFAMLTANVTPKSASFVADTLSSAVSPAIYPEVRKQVLVLAKDPVFQKSGASVRFDPIQVEYEAATNKVFVVGEITTNDATGRISRVQSVYEMEIRMDNGRPQVTAMASYAGADPHTLQWIENNKERLAEQQAQADATKE